MAAPNLDYSHITTGALQYASFKFFSGDFFFFKWGLKYPVESLAFMSLSNLCLHVYVEKKALMRAQAVTWERQFNPSSEMLFPVSWWQRKICPHDTWNAGRKHEMQNYIAAKKVSFLIKERIGVRYWDVWSLTNTLEWYKMPKTGILTGTGCFGITSHAPGTPCQSPHSLWDNTFRSRVWELGFIFVTSCLGPIFTQSSGHCDIHRPHRSPSITCALHRVLSWKQWHGTRGSLLTPAPLSSPVKCAQLQAGWGQAAIGSVHHSRDPWRQQQQPQPHRHPLVASTHLLTPELKDFQKPFTEEIQHPEQDQNIHLLCSASQCSWCPPRAPMEAGELQSGGETGYVLLCSGLLGLQERLSPCFLGLLCPERCNDSQSSSQLGNYHHHKPGLWCKQASICYSQESNRSNTFTNGIKEIAEIKGKQAWLYQDELKVSFILLWAAVHQHVVRAPVQTFCFHTCGCWAEPKIKIVCLPLYKDLFLRWVNKDLGNVFPHPLGLTCFLD